MVILLGRLSLQFRGHKDDFQYHPNVGEYSQNRVCDCTECFGYRVRFGDTGLGNRLKTCSKNPSYISKTSQNELIYCCGKNIKSRWCSCYLSWKSSFFIFYWKERIGYSLKMRRTAGFVKHWNIKNFLCSQLSLAHDNGDIFLSNFFQKQYPPLSCCFHYFTGFFININHLEIFRYLKETFRYFLLQFKVSTILIL